MAWECKVRGLGGQGQLSWTLPKEFGVRQSKDPWPEVRQEHGDGEGQRVDGRARRLLQGGSCCHEHRVLRAGVK